MASVTPITRQLISNNRYGNDSTYRYFSDDVTFSDKYLGKINTLVVEYMDDDDKDYLYELCEYDIDNSNITCYEYNDTLMILNAMKKVLGTSVFHSIVKNSK